MRVVLDTNVALDYLLDREPHATLAGEVLTLAEQGRLQAYICATTVTTIHYVARKSVGEGGARDLLRRLLALVEVAPVRRQEVDAALASPLPDFEDAVLCESARQADADVIVTRDPAGFRGGGLRVCSPSQALAMLEAAGAAADDGSGEVHEPGSRPRRAARRPRKNG